LPLSLFELSALRANKPPRGYGGCLRRARKMGGMSLQPPIEKETPIGTSEISASGGLEKSRACCVGNREKQLGSDLEEVVAEHSWT